MDKLACLKSAGHFHKETRSFIEHECHIGDDLLDLCNKIDNFITTRCNIGFPTGCNVDNIVAHYTPHNHERKYVQKGSIIKWDFGTSVNGWVCDGAFTWGKKHTQLREGVEEATQAALTMCRPDVRVCDIGGKISEILHSYEILPYKNLFGHNILQWHLHGGKQIPLFDNGDETKIEADDVIAIEIFGTQHGRGVVQAGQHVSHFSINDDPLAPKKSKHKELFEHLWVSFKTLPFCPRMIGCDWTFKQLQDLVYEGSIVHYPVLLDSGVSAQSEYTTYVGEMASEVLN